jgi:uncharacterized BrkB/YihY/UPF0761 family membrane protein
MATTPNHRRNAIREWRVKPVATTPLCSPLAILIPTAAHASFNAAPCGTFDCHFQGVGILLGVIGGLPVSGLIFILLHMCFAHPGRSRMKQMLLGGFVGLVAFEIAAAAGAYYAVWRHPPGYRVVFPWEAFLVAYALLAILSVLYARSAPRSAFVAH